MEGPIAKPEELPGRIPDVGAVMLQTPPLMHVSAHWGALQALFGGGTAVLLTPGSFDPQEALGVIEAEGVMVCVLVGDAMGRAGIRSSSVSLKMTFLCPKCVSGVAPICVHSNPVNATKSGCSLSASTALH